MDTDKRSAVESGEKKIHLACTVHIAPQSIKKRTHNHGPEWMEGCWDHGQGHFVNPICDLLTSKFALCTMLVRVFVLFLIENCICYNWNKYGFPFRILFVYLCCY